ncbi:DUF1294 domain-containing protein [Actinobacillus suis]|uniref:DUF1294 domain-containing protein n=2 Tax=Actinobacillus suis TaxID=716 RepID=K0FXV6_ACTSU|nr:DUF1294 domain-containing protein [Actinobacillus suis]AFU19292.1 hypothetical protein ASU2_05770 [Actinobacillus suis H91-0380]MCO4166571.1 DUF1294 domain-containing protein [Actinobacillus suis]MCO4168163.1 DUF1294 domain-containing protein [Actinobacillus suis]MCQ9629586.1 DUF1294 domain-containing protein [Actinobacillus suis]MCQ9631620.1 DUF1294 domain-containing protein [Actinobacillus suis]
MFIFLFIYFLIINLSSFYLMYADKQKSRNKAWRVPESNLFFLCFSGGFIGTFLAMKYIRHKTKHWQFHAAVIISGLLWLIALPAGYYFLIFNH